MMEEVKKTSFTKNPDFKYTKMIGISRGVSQMEETIEGYINRNHKALYKAKENRRNRMIIHTQEKKNRVNNSVFSFLVCV